MTNTHYKEEDEGHRFSKNWDTYDVPGAGLSGEAKLENHM